MCLPTPPKQSLPLPTAKAIPLPNPTHPTHAVSSKPDHDTLPSNLPPPSPPLLPPPSNLPPSPSLPNQTPLLPCRLPPRTSSASINAASTSRAASRRRRSAPLVTASYKRASTGMSKRSPTMVRIVGEGVWVRSRSSTVRVRGGVGEGGKRGKRGLTTTGLRE